MGRVVEASGVLYKRRGLLGGGNPVPFKWRAPLVRQLARLGRVVRGYRVAGGCWDVTRWVVDWGKVRGAHNFQRPLGHPEDSLTPTSPRRSTMTAPSPPPWPDTRRCEYQTSR